MMRKGGFTLLELLVVCVIIGVLIALLLPAFQRARYQGQKVKAQAEAAMIKNAIKAYFHEYAAWPCPPNPGSDAVYANDNGSVIEDYLMAGSPPFLEEGSLFRTNAAAFLDPWDQPYVIVMDTDGDGQANGDYTGVSVKSPLL